MKGESAREWAGQPVATEEFELVGKTAVAAKISGGDEKGQLEERLAERFSEIAELTRLLAEAQQENDHLASHLEWIHGVVPILRRGGFKLRFLRRWHTAAVLARLKEKRLFDSDAYLAANPDVARAGADPLQHYLVHGLTEGRSRG